VLVVEDDGIGWNGKGDAKGPAGQQDRSRGGDESWKHRALQALIRWHARKP